jgi:hypothetical protein
LLWLAFAFLQRDGFNGGSKADKAERGLSKDERKAERIAAIRSAIVFSGPLMIKNTKESMFKSSWKERYFVIASGTYIVTRFFALPLASFHLSN